MIEQARWKLVFKHEDGTPSVTYFMKSDERQMKFAKKSATRAGLSPVVTDLLEWRGDWRERVDGLLQRTAKGMTTTDDFETVVTLVNQLNEALPDEERFWGKP